MHELDMVDKIINLIADQATEQGFGRVKEAMLTIGKMNGLEKRYFTDAIATRTEGPLAQTKLTIEQTSVLLICNSCGNCYEDPRFDDPQFAHMSSHAPQLYLAPPCPECGKHRSRVIAGHEMKLVSIEGE